MEPAVVGPKRRGRKRRRNDVQNAAVGTRSLKLVGRYVCKEFDGSGVFMGKILSYDSGLYRVNYEDGDFEDLDSSEAKMFLVNEGDLAGEWLERKERLDKLFSSKEVAAKVPKVENTIEEANVKEADVPLLDDSSNGDAGASEVVKAHDDGHHDVDADNDSSSSDSYEDTQEPDASLHTEVPPIPPPELPPSSRHIGVPEEHVSNLLSVYSFLRSFSIPLFLYPFSLDDFVGALNCSVANTLLDSIHVSLMRVLKSHLERISADGSELASKSLRSLDWSLLDTVTWPVFLVHYLSMTGHTNGSDWKRFYVHSLEKDYYTLSAGMKLIILQILCDDVLDSEELRVEMDMREESEVGIDIESSIMVAPTGAPRRVHPRYSKTSACNNREAIQSIVDHNEKKSSRGSQVADPVDSSIDEDGNGDECRLCGMDGFLLCCDGCPSSYHARCLGIAKMYMSAGSWYCPECKINETEPKVMQGTTLKGGDNIGVDPYEQVFVASCDHLLVLKASVNTENCLRYYNKHDIKKVFQALCSNKEHIVMYAEICRRIMQYWELPQDIVPCDVMSEVTLKYPNGNEDGDSTIQLVGSLDKSVQEMTENTLYGVSGNSTNTNVKYNGLVTGTSVETKVSYSCVDANARVGRKADGTPCYGFLFMGSSFKVNGYINHYLHGDFAASAAANLAIVSSEENQGPESRSSDNRRKLMSASVSLQVKAFSSAALRFIWPSTEKKLIDVPRERCSWCFCCKAPVSSRRGCLLNAAASNATRGAMKVLAGICPMKNGDGRLPGIATYIVFMEESLRGLVGGPFLNDNFRQSWRRQVEQASFNCIKILLLELEENVRGIALSGDWTKLVDGWSTQSSKAVTTNNAVSTQKRRPGRRGRKPSAAVEVEVDDSQDILPDFTWWRGGMLSKLMFHRGALPCSMLRKAARQGGSKKITGIQYVEGQETPKSSRQLMWRSAVETCRNTAQLALQVRYFDFYLRWSDLVRPEQTPADGKVADAEASAFRNAFICDKKILEHEIRYCVTFGSQKHLPSRVMKNIAEIEQTSDDGKERYWFSETRIPLYLIKEYEEKARETKPVEVLSKLQGRQLKACHKNKLSYLFGKRDKTDRGHCCSCQQDVLYRDAIKCSTCQGFCHDQCASSSTVRVNEEVEFLIICKHCCETRATTLVESTNGSPTSPLLLQGLKFPKRDASNKHGKSVGNRGGSASAKTREHSSMVKSTKKSASSKKSKIKNWGLIWKRNTSDDTGIDFRLNNILHKGSSHIVSKTPSCRLCNQPYNADLMYIYCETCEGWFHADALGLDESKVSELVGFKCCKCRRIKSPTCPYMSPQKKQIELKQTSNTEIFEMDSDSGVFSDFHYEDLHVSDDPLISISELDQCTEDNSEMEYGWNSSTASGPGPRKLPVRRQNKQQINADFAYPVDPFKIDASAPLETNVPISTVKLPVRRKRESNLDCFSATNSFKVEFSKSSEADTVTSLQDSLSPQIQWDVSKENFDENITLEYDCAGYDDMEFEPQTYFSFNELLASDDGSHAIGNESSGNVVQNWENSNVIPENGSVEISYDQEEPMISVEDAIPFVACKICSHTEPPPDLCCQMCCLWIHHHCSPWVEESSSSDDVWRCGNCRDWR